MDAEQRAQCQGWTADDKSLTARAPYASRPHAGAAAHRRAAVGDADRFQRDRDRIVHSTAFRRLAHKTQVFVHTRATISAPASPTRSRWRRSRAPSLAPLRLDDDLAEAIALGHDLGHTPFGHTGEDALDA